MDLQVGKTTLLVRYTTGEFPIDYVTTVFENYAAPMFIENKHVMLGKKRIDREIWIAIVSAIIIAIIIIITLQAYGTRLAKKTLID